MIKSLLIFVLMSAPTMAVSQENKNSSFEKLFEKLVASFCLSKEKDKEKEKKSKIWGLLASTNPAFVSQTKRQDFNKKLESYCSWQATFFDAPEYKSAYHALTGKNDFFEFRFVGKVDGSIESISTNGVQIPAGVLIKSGIPTAVVLQSQDGNFEFGIANNDGPRTTWYYSGAAVDGVALFQVSNSQGVELYIDSNPDAADVYINNKKYYKQTKTSSVEDPGEIEVKLVKDNYKEWKEKKTLSAGGKWTINAKLEAK